ncbi:GNAT family N-acetyltransferase [Qipengyuania psychrotolerans]|uniref:GNAT family N-acetyltransferase n=1 Tax=Qipengyuania psychrotolerans TaxID=2867238 RepID=A0ABX8ZAX9_9SPHN|nr:GNAT family N-acetyltransferase [Qipengyuania psychrotolerans]QZD86155.1 GNAT family N-acetyltransferase [Qipengyuania psychrotolerans]
MTLRIAKAGIDDPDVRALATLHQQNMHAVSPPGTDFALDVSGLSSPDITIVGAWDDGVLIAIGALKTLGNNHAELKSMRTHPDHTGKGAARGILQELIEIARASGVTRLSLETGTSAAFQPAVRLYTTRGFVAGEGFAEYANGPHNQCYHLTL